VILSSQECCNILNKYFKTAGKQQSLPIHTHTQTFKYTQNEGRAADRWFDPGLEYVAGPGSAAPCVSIGPGIRKSFNNLSRLYLCQDSYLCQLSSGLDWLSSELQRKTRCQMLVLNVALSHRVLFLALFIKCFDVLQKLAVIRAPSLRLNWKSAVHLLAP